MLGQRWQHNIIGANTGASHYRLLLSSAPALEGFNVDIDIYINIHNLRRRSLPAAAPKYTCLIHLVDNFAMRAQIQPIEYYCAAIVYTGLSKVV